MAVRKKNEWSQAKEVIEIAENAPYRPRMQARRSSIPAMVVRPNMGVEPAKVLRSLLPPSRAAAVCLDTNRRVVFLAGQRAAGTNPSKAFDAAHDDCVTLTHPVALRAHMAESTVEIEAAKHLIRRRYAWRGYDMPDAEEDSVDEAFNPESSQVVFVAKEHDTTVGTITLGLDGRHGLVAERTYPDAIHDRRVSGCNVCDVTRLAVAEEADSKRVLASLFSLTFATASVHGATHMFVEVNPRHVVFYRRVLGFIVAAGERFCERVKAPSVLLCVEMETLEQQLIKLNARFASLPLEAQAA